MYRLSELSRNIPLRFFMPGVILLAGTAFLLTSLAMEWRAARDRLVSDMTNHVRVIGMALSGQIEAAMRERRPGGIHTAIESIQIDNDLIGAAVLGPDMDIVSATRIEAVNRNLNESEFKNLADLTRHSRKAGHVALRTTEDQRLQAVFPLSFRQAGQSLLPDAEGYLVMEYDLSQRAGIYNRELLADAGYRVTAIATLSFLLWYFFNYRLLKRVQTLGRQARRIGEGDFTSRIEDKYNDELGELGQEFSAMARRLEQNTRELTFQAQHDNLTGLLNRWGIERVLDTLLQRLAHDRREHALIYMDLDQFRVINETWGHSAGDELIRQIARLLGDKVFIRDHIARLGGDEFAILLEDCPAAVAPGKAEEFRSAVEDFRFEWQDKFQRITCSLGVVPIRRGMDHIESLFSLADTACFAAKHGGRNRVHIWQEGDKELQRVHGEMRWVNRIHSALENNRFILYAQPIVPVVGDDGRHRYEILVRMQDEKGGIVPPGEFLAAAEHYHLAGGIDRWVIENTVSRLSARSEYLQKLDMCSINLSGLSFSDNSLSEFVGQIMDRTGPLLPHNICFEITETAAITHLGQAAEFIRRMKAIGCRFALDDFGSGVSSFGYLKNLPVDYIKIDGMFVRDMLDDPVDRALVGAINDVAHKMGMQTIAEFVESEAIKNVLAGIGVDYAQGYGIARPEPLDNLLNRLHDRRARSRN